jgi:hypothetical protein
MGEDDGKPESFGDKLKNPFHELKEALHNTHLHDAKVHLIHQKYVTIFEAGLLGEVLTNHPDTRSGNWQTW